MRIFGSAGSNRCWLPTQRRRSTPTFPRWLAHHAKTRPHAVLDEGGGLRERHFLLAKAAVAWVEQQGVSVEDFDRRKDQAFWRGVAGMAPEWDRLITEFNSEVLVADALDAVLAVAILRHCRTFESLDGGVRRAVALLEIIASRNRPGRSGG